MNLSRFLMLLMLMSPLAAQILGIPPEILEQMRRAGSVPGVGRAFGPAGSPVPAGSEGAEGAEGESSGEASSRTSRFTADSSVAPTEVAQALANGKRLPKKPKKKVLP